MENIIQYLIQKYDPESIIVYGSYADGSHNLGSDFDALLISPHADQSRDVSFVDGIQLDVFVYPADADLRCDELPQLYDCRIVLDKYGKAARLCEEVRSHIDGFPGKSAEEIEVNIAWCEKMLLRTSRGDAEGYFRWHWVLCDSLEFYCDARHKFYFGPKKTLRRMEREDPAAFAVYRDALACFDRAKLESWIKFLRNPIAPEECYGAVEQGKE